MSKKIDTDLVTLLGNVTPAQSEQPEEESEEDIRAESLIDQDDEEDEQTLESDNGIDEPLPKVIQFEIIEPELVKASEVQTILPSSDLLIQPIQEDAAGVKVLLGVFGTTVQDIVRNYTKDREQIDKAIEYFESEVKSSQTSGAKLSPAFIEAWAKLLQAKAEINMSATSSLDSIAKLISAGKGNDLVINLNGKIPKGNLNLEALLTQPKYEDEKGAK
jgi:hypothetical protein